MGESICVHGGGRASSIDFAGGEKRPSIISYVLETPEHHGPDSSVDRASACGCEGSGFEYYCGSFLFLFFFFFFLAEEGSILLFSRKKERKKKKRQRENNN